MGTGLVDLIDGAIRSMESNPIPIPMAMDSLSETGFRGRIEWAAPALKDLLPDLSHDEQLRLENGDLQADGRRGKGRRRINKQKQEEEFAFSMATADRTEGERGALPIRTVQDVLDLDAESVAPCPSGQSKTLSATTMPGTSNLDVALCPLSYKDRFEQRLVRCGPMPIELPFSCPSKIERNGLPFRFSSFLASSSQ